MYIPQILWLLALPVSIYLSYRLIILLLRKYENKYPPDADM